jgi:GNAT superfamily N-acetyltransferase
LSAQLEIRKAQESDIPAILALLADDDLAKLEAKQPVPSHARAFEAISKDANQLLVVGLIEGMIVSTLQITFIPGLSRGGMWRAQIEGVRVARLLRGRGLGRQMLLWSLENCRSRSCGMVQLLMEKRRTGAGRFYEGLGFERNHEGYRLYF